MDLSSLLVGAALLAGLQQSPSPPMQAAGPAAAVTADSATDLLLLDVVYHHMRLESAMPAYQDSSGKRYLPLKQLASALGFRLSVYPARRFASGFLAAPSEEFQFDGLGGYTRWRESSFHFSPNLCFAREGDLFVESDLLQQAAGLRFAFRLSRMEIEVDSIKPLNIEREWIERRQVDTAPLHQPVSLQRVEAPYRLVSRPAFNAQAYTATDPDSQEARQTSHLALDGSGDLLFMTAHYRFMGDSTGKPAALLSLSRDDPSAHLGGPMRANHFEIGDLSLPPVSLFDRARTGMGVTFGNFPTPASGASGSPQIQGMAAGGSVIELYRGDQLLGATKAGPDGRYAFSNVPLEAGANALKLVIVEAEGTVRQEDRVLYGGMDGPKPGEERYRLTVATVGQTLFNAQAYKAAPSMDRKELIGEAQIGLTGSSWLSATTAETWTDAGSGAYGGLGLHTWAGSILCHATGLLSTQGEFAGSVGISRNFGGAIVSLERAWAGNGFDPILVPEIATESNRITSLRVDGAGRTLAYGLAVDRLEGANSATLFRERLSGRLRGLFFSDNNSVRVDGGPFASFGTLQLQHRVGASIALLNVGYGLGAARLLQTGLLSLDKRVATDTFSRYGLDYDATRSAPLGPVAGLYRTFGPMALGLNLGLGQMGRMRASLMISTALPGEGASTAFVKPDVAGYGTARVRVFLDRGLTGRTGGLNAPLPMIGFLVNGHPVGRLTNERGECVLDRLTPNQEVRISLNEDAFENPNWIADRPGVVLVPRPGRQMNVQFGVIETSEIEGKATPAASLAAHPGMVAELVGAGEKVTDTSVLDADGQYVFSRVRPGSYLIRLIDMNGDNVGSARVIVGQGSQLKLDVQISG